MSIIHEYYYEHRKVQMKVKWMGVHCWKLPDDMIRYQQLIFDIRPDIIVETGTKFGGSAFYFAHLLEILGKGKVITVDIKDRRKRAKNTGQEYAPKHERIEYLVGDSVDEKLVNKINGKCNQVNTVMVILDSDHSMDHVLKEIESYGPMVTKGSYMVVEDTNLNGNPVGKGYGPGPNEALEAYMEENNDFIVDHNIENFLPLTYHPGGWLKKVK